MNANKQMLRVGDMVLWFPFGSLESNETTVRSIEVDCGGEKTGRQVNEVSWEDVHKLGHCVITLSNGRWAFGYQIKPMEAL